MRLNYLIFLVLFISINACQKIDDVGVLVPPTVNQDAALPSISIEVNGILRKIHTRTYGNPSNPLLIILHGTYSDTKPYTDLAISLSDNYYVLLYYQWACNPDIFCGPCNFCPDEFTTLCEFGIWTMENKIAEFEGKGWTNYTDHMNQLLEQIRERCERC